ncbi:CpsB/CapC family capsule biosynthesis tyrosine phosphatase [uncultured Muribaculum sp.]|uniref:tyrosine-protein phosphatase n=1 Tax=uncultured Muribaculum sp. TaxID=1918613 RepID=UPI0025CB81F5|nr:CpsB/CapC family capsule biosynthesis tyrosine phosphatase [uncultured Muribaculum sp.]
MWPFTSSTTTIARSGILEGATEWHSHLLPGVDDGIKKIDETIETLRLMGQAGIRRVHLTPHIMEDVPNTPADLRKRFDDLCAAVAGDSDIPPLVLGAENMLDPIFTERFTARDFLTIATRNPASNDTLLVETSYANPPMGLFDILKDVRSAGYFPLLAHPERYLYMSPADYRRLKDDGVMLQLNLPSITGFYGPNVQQRAIRLLQDGMYDYTGSDTHSLKWFRRLLDAPIRRSLVKHLLPIMR